MEDWRDGDGEEHCSVIPTIAPALHHPNTPVLSEHQRQAVRVQKALQGREQPPVPDDDQAALLQMLHPGTQSLPSFLNT